jgi:hypothetical protein
MLATTAMRHAVGACDSSQVQARSGQIAEQMLTMLRQARRWGVEVRQVRVLPVD